MTRTSVMVMTIVLATAVMGRNVKAGSNEDLFLKLVRQRLCQDGICNNDEVKNAPDNQGNIKQRGCMTWVCGKRVQSDDNQDSTTKRARCRQEECQRSFPLKREIAKKVKTRTQSQKRRKCMAWGCKGKRVLGLHDVIDLDSRRSRKLSDMLKKQRDSGEKLCLSWDCDKRKADSPQQSDLSEDKRTKDILRSMDDEASRRFRDFLIRQRPSLRKRASQYPEN